MKRLIDSKAIPKNVQLAVAAVVIGGLGLVVTTLLRPAPKPAPAPPPAAPVAAAVPRPNTPEFAACDWGEVKGARFSIWSFNCGAGKGDAHLEPDTSLPGFWMVGGGGRYPAIRIFTNPDPTAPDLAGALGVVRAASPGPSTASCVFTPATGVDDKGKYWFSPTGAAKAAWEKQQAEGSPGDPPCGPLGEQLVGDRYFWTLPGHPELVVYADMGSEIQIFDPETVKLVAQ